MISATEQARLNGWVSLIVRPATCSSPGQRIHLAHRLHDAGIHRHRHGERLEGRAQLVDAERRAVEARLDRAIARGIGVELRQRGHRQDLAGVDVHDDPGRADRRKLRHRALQLMLERLLDRAGDRQFQRRAALRRIAQPVVERALDPGAAIAVDVGIAEHVRGERGLRIEPVGLARQRHPRLAERVDRVDQPRRGAAAEIIEFARRAEHGEIGRGVLFGHQLGQLLRQRELVADDLRRLDADRPGVDRHRQRLAVAVDDVAALGGEVERPALAPGMVAERREIDQAQHDQRDDPAVDQHPDHQPLVHHRENLAALSDEAEPLGPCDESGRSERSLAGAGFLGGFRQLVAIRVAPAAVALGLGGVPDKGPSGSAVAVLTGFTAGAGLALARCSPAGLAAGLAGLASAAGLRACMARGLGSGFE